MSTVGNVVFSFIMMSVSLILIVESVRQLATHGNNPNDQTTEFHVPAIVAVSIAFFVKFCLFSYCWGLRQFSQVSSSLLEGSSLTVRRFEFSGRIIETIYSSMDLV